MPSEQSGTNWKDLLSDAGRRLFDQLREVASERAIWQLESGREVVPTAYVAPKGGVDTALVVVEPSGLSTQQWIEVLWNSILGEVDQIDGACVFYDVWIESVKSDAIAVDIEIVNEASFQLVVPYFRTGSEVHYANSRLSSQPLRLSS